MAEKLITKSFERLLDKGKHRGFITYEELGKSLGKRNGSHENIEKALIILVDEKISLVEKKSQYQSNKKRKTHLRMRKKLQIRVMILLGCILEKWEGLNFSREGNCDSKKNRSRKRCNDKCSYTKSFSWKKSLSGKNK